VAIHSKSSACALWDGISTTNLALGEPELGYIAMGLSYTRDQMTLDGWMNEWMDD
jgi:hypothetical protein